MRVGAVFPQAHFGDDLGLLRDFAQAAEDLGYAHIVAYDHVLGASHAGRESSIGGPYNENHPFREPLTMFAYLAGITGEIELVTGILILPQRQTALVAKQAAEVSLLSAGRFRLGVGIGWNRLEYQALNEGWEGRGDRCAEQIEVLRAFWTEELVDFKGRFHSLDRVSILPRPDAPVPIWIGGQSEAAYRRAARLADGFIFPGPQENVLERLDLLSRCVEQAGREPGSLGLETFVDYGAGPNRWLEDLDTYRDAGFTHVAMRLVDDGAAGAAGGATGPIDALARYAEVIGLKASGGGHEYPKYATISTGNKT